MISKSHYDMQVPVRAGITKGEVTGDLRNHTLSEINHQSPATDCSLSALFLESDHLLQSMYTSKELGERQMLQHS